MEHLSALDASFLEAENSDPHVSLAIGAVSILAGPVPRYDDLVSAFAERVRAIPRCTQMLHTHPLDLGSPEWVEDPHFDISHHVHRVALPDPGDDAELFQMVSTVMRHRLDRERPLWDCWIIEGLTDNRWAVLVKLHHCIADGIATTELLGKLSDDGLGSGSDSFAKNIRAAKQSDELALRLPPMTRNPVTWLGGIWRTAVAAAAAAEHAAVGVAELTASLLSSPPESSLTGPVTTMRRYSAARVRLVDMEKVSRAFGVTLNDVALSAITDSYRKLLLSRGEQPHRDSLRTLVPVSVRSMKDFRRTDNRVSAMLPLLPVDEADPVKQLELVHSRLATVKSSGQREAGNTFVAAANAIPFALWAWTVRLVTRLPQRAVVTVATNVPGSRRRQQLMGREVLEVLPVPPIALGLRTAIAMVSYADSFVFGITADYDTAPDIDQLAAGIEQAVAQLVDVIPIRRRKHQRVKKVQSA
ncbi:wax ester/triacylglycerol synthase family O-acyltransferase [Mycobacterium haemophilum]|uniref:Diacylglycerol O-acyltransferase n=1 Tax=Mycobacterium haemophilum TaxID=29311 RepID=A0A0I9ZTL1_9MYCO|nr:wax ester/triacylglycerol synthase family O-acyltransferase [Mycobacterium haemophilum]KLO33739.1 diacylglycerol O-acyltransferase [Mycobacterium haemophilum]KLO39264.1 diacylglycerol O-acyltransferase [Mycobacterium haemophilum]KLO45574.1 diacylglycerol O-acyltransferase [Mycobacterium haemophilum]KLO56722.1 diacylglycerol O-acyltransferase [Mycobacterium haemophilum]